MTSAQRKIKQRRKRRARLRQQQLWNVTSREVQRRLEKKFDREIWEAMGRPAPGTGGTTTAVVDLERMRMVWNDFHDLELFQRKERNEYNTFYGGA